MDWSYKNIVTHEDFVAFCEQLNVSGLPYQDLALEKQVLIGFYTNNKLVGTGALEIHNEYALLRSLSVTLGLRGRSLGSTITDSLIDIVRKHQLKGIYLLTETAREFFHKKGFIDVSRDEVPGDIKNSTEFSHVCPTTAACMYLKIQ